MNVERKVSGSGSPRLPYGHWNRTRSCSQKPELAALRNRQKIRGLQAGAADQRAVDIRHRHQFFRIRRLYRAAVENADLATFGLEAAGEGTTDEAMNLLDIGRRRRQPGADRPD